MPFFHLVSCVDIASAKRENGFHCPYSSGHILTSLASYSIHSIEICITTRTGSKYNVFCWEYGVVDKSIICCLFLWNSGHPPRTATGKKASELFHQIILIAIVVIFICLPEYSISARGGDCQSKVSRVVLMLFPQRPSRCFSISASSSAPLTKILLVMPACVGLWEVDPPPIPIIEPKYTHLYLVLMLRYHRTTTGVLLVLIRARRH